MKEKTIVIGFHGTPETKTAIKIAATRRNITMSRWILKAILEQLKREQDVQ